MDTMRENLRLRGEWYALGAIECERDETGDPDGVVAAFAMWAQETPMDGRTMRDRWLQFRANGMHWHVQRHGEDDDVFATYDVAAALDYAATELDRIAEHKREGASGYADGGDFRRAWVAVEVADHWSTLAANLRNLHRNHTADETDRAPLYRGEGAADRLAQALTHALHAVASDSPSGFAVWACGHDLCRPVPSGEERPEGQA